MARAKTTCGGRLRILTGRKHVQNRTYRNVHPTRIARRPETAKDFVQPWIWPSTPFGQNGTATSGVCALRMPTAWESPLTMTKTEILSITRAVDASIAFAAMNRLMETVLAIVTLSFLGLRSDPASNHTKSCHPRVTFVQDTTGRQKKRPLYVRAPKVRVHPLMHRPWKLIHKVNI